MEVVGDSIAGVNTSILYRTTGLNFLFDVGDGATIALVKKKFSFSRLNAVFITHSHPDHFYGLGSLLYYIGMAYKNHKIKIFCPETVKGKVTLFIAETKTWENVEVKTVKPDEKINFKHVVVKPFETKHTVLNLGYIIEEKKMLCIDKEKVEEDRIPKEYIPLLMKGVPVKIRGREVEIRDYFYETPGSKVVYTGDTEACENVVKAAEGAEILISEATYLEDRRDKAEEYKHLTVKDAAQIASEANVKKLILVHRSPRYDKYQIYSEGEKYFSNIVKW